MTISARIDNDCKSLQKYFQKLFEVLHDAIDEDRNAPMGEAEDMMALESQQSYYPVSHFVKPDMLINVYSLVDFWLKQICKNQQLKNNLALSHADIKGDNDLQAYHKYLTKYARLDLTAIQQSYVRLHNLRVVRNQLIHHGGHVSTSNAKVIEQLSAIEGITLLFGTQIHIDDNFVWDVLDHAKKYLCGVAQA